MENTIKSDISKIIKAKNQLHNEILDELEKIIHDKSIYQMKGGNKPEKINNNIKILGTIDINNKISNKHKNHQSNQSQTQIIRDRLDNIQRTKPMSLDEAVLFLNDKLTK